MENKQTAPKEIFIYCGKNHISTNWTREMFDKETDIKYLSETHVQELLAEKDKEIRDLVKLVAERNAELAEKEREIEQLKKQLEK